MYLSLLDLMRQAGSLMGRLEGAGSGLELADEGGQLVCRAVLNGIDPKSVQIQVTETGLAIGGSSTREERTEGPEFIQVQSSRSSFVREVPLPARVNPRGASAHWHDDGRTLIVTLPKQ